MQGFGARLAGTTCVLTLQHSGGEPITVLQDELKKLHQVYEDGDSLREFLVRSDVRVVQHDGKYSCFDNSRTGVVKNWLS